MNLFWVWVALMWVGQMADVATTAFVLRLGCTEANPLLPAHIEGIVVVKVVACCGFTGLAAWLNHSEPWKAIFGLVLAAAIGAAAAAWNLAVAPYCGGLGR